MTKVRFLPGTEELTVYYLLPPKGGAMWEFMIYAFGAILTLDYVVARRLDERQHRYPKTKK
jgi:hypothetical protein